MKFFPGSAATPTVVLAGGFQREKLFVDAIVFGKVVHVFEKNAHVDQILHRAAGGRENCFQVVENGSGLDFDVIGLHAAVISQYNPGFCAGRGVTSALP